MEAPRARHSVFYCADTLAWPSPTSPLAIAAIRLCCVRFESLCELLSYSYKVLATNYDK